MGNFEDLFIKFMFVGIIVFAAFSFVFLFQSENAVVDGFGDNELINSSFNDLRTKLEGVEAEAQAQKDLFEKDNPVLGLVSLILTSIVSAGKVFNSMIVGVFNTLIILPVTFLGLDKIITSVLSTIFIVVIIIGLWRLYKLGG